MNHVNHVKFVDEFKSFLLRGNVMDLAVAVVVGGAFTGIVQALVADVIMPPVSLLTGKGWDDNFVVLKDGLKAAPPYHTLQSAKDAGADVWAYGHFMTQVVNFLIVGLVIFIAIKMISRLYKAPPPVDPDPTPTEKLLTEIRDQLKERR